MFVGGEMVFAQRIIKRIDSTLVIPLVTKGGGVVRTKHLQARKDTGNDAIGEKQNKHQV